MATLNIKNFPDALYKKLQAQAKRERRSVAQEVMWLLNKVLTPPQQSSILELKGLGSERRTAVDATDHVEKERSSWD